LHYSLKTKVKKMGMMLSRVEEIATNLEKIGILSPEELDAWHSITDLASQDGALDLKSKELIAVSLSVVAKCDWCTAYHVKKSLDLGATIKEIVEAAWLAVLMGGSPALMQAQRVLQALEEFKDLTGYEKNFPDVMYEREIGEGMFKKRLSNYVRSVCDTSEAMCRGSKNRRRLALNFAKTDGGVLRRLVEKEGDRRGWNNEASPNTHEWSNKARVRSEEG
jgi:AhpD family alkylhydroperoxidase